MLNEKSSKGFRPVIEPCHQQEPQIAKMKESTWKRDFMSCCMATLGNREPFVRLFGSSWIKGLSPLYWRIPILLWVISILTWSMTTFWGPFDKFFIYMTHWGLIMILVEIVFGIFVTLKKHRNELPDATFGLPWYVKTYWVLYNITVPVAFLITMFYWGLLRNSGKKLPYHIEPPLDINLHAANSLVMFVELVFSAHPSHLLHIMQPLYFAGVYLLFTIIYYLAGGTDPGGRHFIYPVIDWDKPLMTLVVIALTGLFIALMHLIVVSLSKLRDYISKQINETTAGVYNDGFEA